MSAERSPDVRRSPPKNIFGGRPADPRGTGRSPRVSARIRAEPRRKVFRRANSQKGLLARRKNFRRGFARIRADSARFRADPPDVRQKYFSADVRRIRAEPGGVRAFPRGFGRNRGGRSSAEPIAQKGFGCIVAAVLLILFSKELI